ncbi:hypothetical protein JOD82_000699 [Paenibacillus sp. 1182]|nr:hypothetical protein [Paenibacillus sp. 1182]MDQ0048597.1 hypothetical protein [Paenibacillus polymyxa]
MWSHSDVQATPFISSTTYIQGEFQWLEVQVLTHL